MRTYYTCEDIWSLQGYMSSLLHARTYARSEQLKSRVYLNSVPHVVQHGVVDRFSDISNRSLDVGWSDDLVCSGRVLVGGQDADFSPGHLLLMDVHCL